MGGRRSGSPGMTRCSWGRDIGLKAENWSPLSRLWHNVSDREVGYGRKWHSVLAVSAHCNLALKNPAMKREIKHFTPHDNHSSSKAQSSEERAKRAQHRTSLGGAGRKGYFLCGPKPKVWYSKEYLLQPQSRHADLLEITRSLPSTYPSDGEALSGWVLQMDTQGFSPRLDIFKAMVEKLTQEEGWGSLGLAWLREYLNRHPALSTRLASTMDRQRAFANAPGLIKDYFWKLRDVIIRYKIKEENMWNMSEKRFTLNNYCQPCKS